MTHPPQSRLNLVTPATFVVVGAGQAGAQAALALREHGFRGRIVLLGEEPDRPYTRPPLSKKFLSGGLEEERVFLRPSALYEAQGIELKLGVRVAALDTRAARIELDNGLRLPYDGLLLATGSRSRRLEVPGAGGPGIFYLRSLADARRLHHAIAPGRRVAIIGGGYIGLEVAATASAMGARVRVLEAGARVLGRVTTEPVSEYFTRLHRDHGVDVRCGVRVVAFEGTDRLEALACAHGRFEADVAVVGVGAEPNDALARAAGIACDDGIVVDERCRTSAANVYAAGDCASHPSRLLGRRVRLESVQNAVDQATVAARNLCGHDVAYDKVPWFWSEQYGIKLQTAGFSEGCDEVVTRGDPAQDAFALLYRRAGRLVGVDAVNMTTEYLAGRREIASPPADAARHVRTA